MRLLCSLTGHMLSAKRLGWHEQNQKRLSLHKAAVQRDSEAAGILQADNQDIRHTLSCVLQPLAGARQRHFNILISIMLLYHHLV